MKPVKIGICGLGTVGCGTFNVLSKNADVIAIAAAYGYLAQDAKAEDWYADFILRSADQLEPLLNLLKFA